MDPVFYEMAKAFQNSSINVAKSDVSEYGGMYMCTFCIGHMYNMYNTYIIGCEVCIVLVCYVQCVYGI